MDVLTMNTSNRLRFYFVFPSAGFVSFPVTHGYFDCALYPTINHERAISEHRSWDANFTECTESKFSVKEPHRRIDEGSFVVDFLPRRCSCFLFYLY